MPLAWLFAPWLHMGNEVSQGAASRKHSHLMIQDFGNESTVQAL